MKDKENMIITKIQGTDFTYNKETHYEKDGHIYCKTWTWTIPDSGFII